MKYKHLFWAIILIAVGIFFILNNFGILNFSWYNFWMLWPVLLILWGISILPIKDTVKFVLLIAVLLGSGVMIHNAPSRGSWLHHFHRNGPMSWEWNDEEDDDENASTGSNTLDQNLSVPFDSLTKKGTLDLDAAAGKFIFRGETNEMLAFSKSGDIGNYELTTSDGKEMKEIRLKLQGKSSVHHSGKNQVDIRLNTKPAWNLRFEVGAASMDLDLSNYKIDTADFEAGASSITIRLGDKNPLSVLTFNAGASSIHVEVPKSAGCQVSSESFLASKSFDGFHKKEGHIYQTDNFGKASSKIMITVKTAVSSIDIRQY